MLISIFVVVITLNNFVKKIRRKKKHRLNSVSTGSF